MKYGDAYEKCKRLVTEFGWTKGLTPKYKMYTDTLGCDFQIYYDTARGSMNVFFGGREVYAFSKYEPDEEYLISGRWMKLVHKIYGREVCRRAGDKRAISGVFLKMCRRDAARNRKLMDWYRELVIKLAESGRVKMRSGSTYCTLYEDMIGGHVIEGAYLNVMDPEKNEDYRSKVELHFDRRTVFVFRYDSSDKNGILDEKGKYVSGKWEKIIENLLSRE